MCEAHSGFSIFLFDFYENLIKYTPKPPWLIITLDIPHLGNCGTPYCVVICCGYTRSFCVCIYVTAMTLLLDWLGIESLFTAWADRTSPPLAVQQTLHCSNQCVLHYIVPNMSILVKKSNHMVVWWFILLIMTKFKLINTYFDSHLYPFKHFE